jgi:hypothetical protein
MKLNEKIDKIKAYDANLNHKFIAFQEELYKKLN